MHELEVQGIADGDVADRSEGVRSYCEQPARGSPRSKKREKDPAAQTEAEVQLRPRIGEEKRRGPRYTPLSKRQDRPAAILWLVKFHPELADSQIGKLVGTTKPTIASIRERTHWNINNITPIDPVALGLCRQTELDAAVQKAAKKKTADGAVMTDDERRKLVSTEQSLGMSSEPKMPTAIAGLENFSLSQSEDEEEKNPADYSNADAFFNLPHGDDDDEDEDEDDRR